MTASLPKSYCDAAPGHPFHGPYHDREYGFPMQDDQALFERLILEINQAGLSWLTILQKRAGFRSAYHHFDIGKVAAYGDHDRSRLLADPGIIRNRLKIDAAIYNAQEILRLQKSHGSFHRWLRAYHPLEKPDWVKLFKRHFRFVGGEIVGEFLMSLGYLPGAHNPDCPIFHKIMRKNPPWAEPQGGKR